MRSDLGIREATPIDASVIANVYRQAKLQSLPELVTDLDRDLAAQSARWERYMTHGSDGHVCVAEVTGQAEGYAAWHKALRPTHLLQRLLMGKRASAVVPE